MTFAFKVLSILCASALRSVMGQRAWGISLRGGGYGDGSVPAVGFGPVADVATIVATDLQSTALEVKRQGETAVAFGTQLTKLPRTVTSGGFDVAGEVAARGAPQWTLWDLDTFDTPSTGMWSLNDRGFCSSPEDHFLGGHCRFGATTTKRTYSLPAHSRVKISARVHFIDKWEGESVSLLVHGQPVWSESHHWCPGFLKWMCEKYGIDTCGRNNPDRLSVKAEAIVAHSGPSLDIEFTSSLPAGTDACYQSWGVDDVSIELM